MTAIVSLVVVHYGENSELVERLLGSLHLGRDRSMFGEIVVVDNGNRLASVARSRVQAAWPEGVVSVIGNNGDSYASGVNAGVRATRGELVAVSNNDVEWLPDCSIAPLIDAFADPQVAAVGPQLRYPDGGWQRSHGALPSVPRALATVLFLDTLGRAVRAARETRSGANREVRGYIDGAFMLIRRSCFDSIGGFDEEFGFYGEDADFCDRARRAGWRLLFVPAAEVMHVRGASSARGDLDRARRLLDAETRLVRRRSGESAARLYRILMTLGYAERMFVYGLLAHIRPAARWQSRCELARARYLAGRGH